LVLNSFIKNLFIVKSRDDNCDLLRVQNINRRKIYSVSARFSEH